MLCVTLFRILARIRPLLGALCVVALLSNRFAASIDAVVEPHARTIVDVNVMHTAGVGADAAGMVGFKPANDLLVLAAGRVEVHGAAGSVKAALA